MQQFAYTGLPWNVRFGRGTARRDLLETVTALGDRALVVCTTAEEPLARRLAAPLGTRVVDVFTDVRPHVPAEVAAGARASAEAAQVDVLVAIGGGSTIGAAKAVALRSGLPIVAVPTTFAGSEMTPVWGMTEDGRKVTGTDGSVLPRAVIYDPELTTTLPQDVAAASAVNALAHCLEALWAPAANPLTELVALEGVRTLVRGLRDLSTAPAGLATHEALLYGACLGGTAFAVAGSGLHHKLCHVLGGAYDLPHAATHAAVLPQVVAVRYGALPAARIGRALGVSSPEDTALAVYRLVVDAGLPVALREIGLGADALDDAIALACDVVAASEAAATSEAEVRDVLTRAFDGVVPGQSLTEGARR